MSLACENDIYLIYSNKYEDKEEKRVREGLDANDVEFAEIRRQLSDLAEIGRHDLVASQRESFIKNHMAEYERREWSFFLDQLKQFQHRNRETVKGYIILGFSGEWRSPRFCFPTRGASLHECVRKTTEQKKEYQMRVFDRDGQFRIVIEDESGESRFHIVELLDEKYAEEIEEDGRSHTIEGYVDGEFLYNLANPNSDPSTMARFLREQCSDLFYRQRQFGKNISEEDRRPVVLDF